MHPFSFWRNDLKKPLYLALISIVLVPGLALAVSRHETVEQLTRESEKVVLGTVISRTSYWTADSMIYTDVVIVPDLIIKGQDEGTLVVRVPGGLVGDTQVTVSDAPAMLDGERVFVFLNPAGDHFEVVGREGGKYSVGTNSNEVAAVTEAVLQDLENSTGRSLSFKRSEVRSLFHRLGLSSSAVSTSAATAANGSTAQAAATGTCYSTTGAKWPSNAAVYKIGASLPAGWEPSIAAATSTWRNAGANFSFSSDLNSPNELSYTDLVGKYGSSYTNTYAVTTTWTTVSSNQITKATIEFNSQFQWSTYADANSADVQNILTHELGHWLRLGDIYQPAACSEVTMWGYAALGETKKRSLEQPDIDGITNLYGQLGSLSGPVLVRPFNAATGVSWPTALNWAPVVGATSYDVYFGTTATPSLAATVTGTSYPAGFLAPNTTYYWTVVAKSPTGTANSDVWSFTTASSTGTAMLSTPVLLTPSNGATGISSLPIFSWGAVSGADSYEIYVGNTPTPVLLGSTRNTSVRIQGFQSGAVYYWKIVARSTSASSTSAVWSFQTN